MDLYISGPIKGVDDARDRFLEAVDLLTGAGHTVVNPFDIDALCLYPCKGESDTDHHYDCFMRGDLAAMMATGGVALLPGWEASRGARLEQAIAVQVGLPARPYQQWQDACIGCGCTDADCSQCVANTGHPCHWVRRNLCSACADVY